MKYVVFLVALAVVVLQCEGKTFSRCELAHELRRQGFPEDKLRDWVCLVEHESNARSHVIGYLNTDGSLDYGLFQINDRYWCNRSGGAGKDCNVSCADLLTDDITKAANCAKKVYKRHGFNAWNAWKSYCQWGLPDISFC